MTEKKEMRDAVAEAVQKSDFFFVVAGKKNEDGSFSSTQAVQGNVGDLSRIISHAFKDYSELEQAIFAKRIAEQLHNVFEEVFEEIAPMKKK